MTISSDVRKAGPYNGNGVTTSFPFSFKVFSANDVVVVLTDPVGTETTLTGGTDYSVTLNADQDTAPGGTVEKVSALATGYLLTITSSVPNLQPLDLTNQGGFYPKVINSALDRLTILAQQNAEQIGRSVKVPISSSVTPDSLIAKLTQDAAMAAASESAAAGSATAAATSATAANASQAAAAASESAAATSATAAANSATAASNSAATATTQAGNAAASATAAATSATNAANASRLTIGTVTTGSAGSSASATITGAAGSQVLNLTIPRGDTGPQGPQGPEGPQGPQGPQGPAGAGTGDVLGPGAAVTADALAQWSGTTGTNIKAVMFSGLVKLASGVPSAALAGTDYVVPAGSITGNAATTTKLKTARTLTIGNTGKSFDGSANVSWSLAEIGVTAATESSAGIVELATTAEAQALASAVVALTPARLADAFKGANQSLSSNGYQKLPGGLIIQWGAATVTTDSNGNATITFPIAFTTACAVFVPVRTQSSYGGATSFTINTYDPEKSNTKIYLLNSTNSVPIAGASVSVRWYAIGY